MKSFVIPSKLACHPLRRSALIAILLIVVDLACPFPTPAQQPAQPSAPAIVSGVLLDPAKSPIPAAKIHLTSQAAALEATTAADGSFQLNIPSPGQYRLTVDANGLTAAFAQPINLAAGALSIVLKLSERGELTLIQEKSKQAAG